MNTTIQKSTTATLAIDGMSCGHCVQAVTKALSAVPGVKVRSVAVGSAVIETADWRTTEKAVSVLDEAGYPAKSVDDAVEADPTRVVKSGGGCCGGAPKADGESALPKGGGGAKNSGCCCG